MQNITLKGDTQIIKIWIIKTQHEKSILVLVLPSLKTKWRHPYDIYTHITYTQSLHSPVSMPLFILSVKPSSPWWCDRTRPWPWPWSRSWPGPWSGSGPWSRVPPSPFLFVFLCAVLGFEELIEAKLFPSFTVNTTQTGVSTDNAHAYQY